MFTPSTTMIPATPANIVTMVRQKLSHIHNTTGKPYKIPLYFGRAEWEAFEIMARHEWMIHIKSHQTNWIAGTRIMLDSRFAAGIYTAEEAASEIARRGETAVICDDPVPDFNAASKAAVLAARIN